MQDNLNAATWPSSSAPSSGAAVVDASTNADGAHAADGLRRR